MLFSNLELFETLCFLFIQININPNVLNEYIFDNFKIGVVKTGLKIDT